ncbi:MAG: FkbM family methyltransferase [Bacteroidota bacterium]|nr:FkbM family methyltransferase [Bacteroidota bacterium]MDP4217578.1 FkbM family methyltransferase [Bacteroidota bacterium]MDP4245003.1 FkbM family methyltransferase [Bacteroidota bacterium]MDP4252891.1 FkbM family methyltransferase [Bacteroidota bacterium]
MPLLRNLIAGVNHRLKKILSRPYSVFDIGWLKEKTLKHQTDTGLKHHVYKRKYKIAYRDGPTFLMSIKELFIDEFYKFRPDSDHPRIIDCGSYIGTSILFFKVNYPHAIITGFEPDASNYSLLKSNVDNWGFSGIEIFNAAIWVNNENVSFHSAGNMSSRIEAGANERDDQKMVRCVRLNDLLHEQVDFLKIDIEGAELPVLRDCSDNLKNVKNLFVEYHGKYSELSDLNEILEILYRSDFKYCIKEGNAVHARPLWEGDSGVQYDMLLNIFAFRG